MSKRNAIGYIQNEEPSFIRQFKEKIGYKEGPDVDTKVIIMIFRGPGFVLNSIN